MTQMQELAAMAKFSNSGKLKADWLVSQSRWILVAVAILVPAILNPHFRSYANLQGFLQSIGVLLILAMGESFVLLTAGIDLSVGAVVAMGSVVLTALLQAGLPCYFAIIVTCLSGLAIGLANGACVHLLRIPSFIVTFALMGVAYSAGLVISNGDRVPLPAGNWLPGLATGQILGLPYQIIVVLVLVGLGTLMLRHFRIGRGLYAVGGNLEAARLSGLPIGRITLFAFALSGLFSGVAAVVYTARIVSGNPIGGVNLNLEAIAAAVIGGVSLFGGRGTLVGACFGTIVYGLIQNILDIYNVNPSITEIVAGAVVVLAGLMNVLMERRQADE